MDRRTREPVEPKREGISPAAFIVAIVVMIVLALLVIFYMVLYNRKNGNLINPSNCPPAVSGLVATPDTTINTVGTNCGSQANCTYTVSTLGDAAIICTSLGTKCAAFTLTPIAFTSTSTMTVASTTGTSVLAGSDTYVPVT